MFEFFIQNNLIKSEQSGFKTGESCINQLINITHEYTNHLIMATK